MTRSWPLILALAGCATTPSPVSTTSAELDGAWASRGAGWILSIDGSDLTLFDVTAARCAMNPDGGGALEETYDRFVRSGDELRLYEPFKQTYETFDRIDGVPTRCRAEPDDSPVSVFEAFAAELRENYPFFEVHGIDWEERVRAARTKVSAETSPTALLEIFRAMLRGLRDGHVRLSATIDGDEHVIAPHMGRTLLRAEAIDRGATTSWLNRYRARVMTELLGDTGKYVANRRIAYGRIGRIGYVNIVVFEGYSTEEGWGNELAAARAAMSEVVAALRDVDAVIVDLSNNRGGISVVAEAIAGFFTREPLVYGSIRRPGGDRQALVVRPAVDAFVGPVYLLTSDVTVSGGERLTLALRKRQVTHVGAPTRGALSKILPKYLPNGWWLWLSNQTLLDHRGVSWEGIGIPPDIEVPVFDPQDPNRGHIEAVRHVVSLAEGSLSTSSSTTTTPSG